MRTPADFFRKNQKIMLVVITGLAILSFLVSDATNGRTEDMSPTLIVVTAGVLVGGACWLIGMARDRGSEWGLVGVIIGVLFGLVVNANRTQNNSMSEAEMRRSLNELKVASVVNQRLGRPPINSIEERDVLLDEANRLGISLPENIAGLQMKAAGLTQDDYDQIKKNFQVSDGVIADGLKKNAEVEIVLRGMFGYPQNVYPSVTPIDWWNAYQKINVKETAVVAALPVESFIDPAAQPKDADLAVLFDEYKGNPPNFTREGRPAEGRPGFFQPDKAKIRYLIGNVEDFEKSVPEPTKEEIEARYEERYKGDAGKPFPEKPTGPTLPGLGAGSDPALPKPELPLPEAPKENPGDAPKGETPPPASPEKEPAKPATPDAKPEDKAPEAPVPEAKPEEKPAAPEAPKEGEGAKSSSLERNDGTSEVALLDDPKTPAEADAPKEAPAEPAQEKPAEPAKDAAPTAEAPKADAPKADAPKEGAPAADAGKPDGTTPPAGEPETPPPPPTPKGSDTDEPPPPTSKDRPLDDDLRQTLKEEIITERARKALQDRCDKVTAEIRTVLENAHAPRLAPRPGDAAPEPPKDDPDYLTPEQALKAIEKIAADNQLQYVETKLISAIEIFRSKDHPLKNVTTSSGDWRQGRAIDVLFQAGSPLNTPTRGSNMQDGTELVFWKTEYITRHEPKTLAEVKDEVVAAWREQEARKRVEKRAEELLAKVKASGKPMAEALQAETVTGVKDSLLIETKPTGSFSWITYFDFGAQFRSQMPPRLSNVAGVTEPGDEFMKTVFEKLKPGEVGVAHNGDKSVYYLVNVETREAATPEEMATFRKGMLDNRLQSQSAQTFAQSDAAMFQTSPFERLFPRDEAELIEEDQ
jgi:hypothetical protein